MAGAAEQEIDEIGRGRCPTHRESFVQSPAGSRSAGILKISPKNVTGGGAISGLTAVTSKSDVDSGTLRASRSPELDEPTVSLRGALHARACDAADARAAASQRRPCFAWGTPNTRSAA